MLDAGYWILDAGWLLKFITYNPGPTPSIDILLFVIFAA
jgi:hypothetical protein